jgi:hypothetical protein
MATGWPPTLVELVADWNEKVTGESGSTTPTTLELGLPVVPGDCAVMPMVQLPAVAPVENWIDCAAVAASSNVSGLEVIAVHEAPLIVKSTRTWPLLPPERVTRIRLPLLAVFVAIEVPEALRVNVPGEVLAPQVTTTLPFGVTFISE